MDLIQFGAKAAGYVDLHKAPKPAKKQLSDHEVFNNALMRAQAAGESPSPELFTRIQDEHAAAQKKEKEKEKTAMDLIQFGMKVAQSSCTPCAMPNSPTNKQNKKHMTSASPAVLEAGEKSEEIGKPDVTETEHAEAEAKLPEEGAKSAYEFGMRCGRLLGY